MKDNRFPVENRITDRIIGGAIEVHKTLGGPGLLESVYEEALAYELASRGLDVVRQKSVPIIFKGIQLSTPLRLDLLIEGKVIVECKAVLNLDPIFEAQCLTYLRLMDLRVGLVINFGNQYVRQGIRRVVN